MPRPAAAPTALLIPLLLIGVTVAALCSLLVGPVPLSPAQVLGSLFGSGDRSDILIVQDIRLPRTILAVTIGATLGVSGAALQGLVRNPLASPSLFGASSAAALGAVIVLGFGIADALSFVLPLAAIATALLSVGLLIFLAGPHASTLTLILAGLALSSLASALVSLVLNITPNPFAALELAFWLLGSLEDRSVRHVILFLPFAILSWALLISSRGGLRALSLGDDVGASLGVDIVRLRFIVVLGVGIGVGAAVAVSGVVGFVGLVVPHLVRPFVGHDPARLHIPAALAGALLLTTADIFTRIIPATGEIKLGVLTALIGVPFFLWLVLRRRRDDLLQTVWGT